MNAVLQQLTDRILSASASRTALCIRGGGSKDFYGNPPKGEPLDTRGLRGVVDYQPSELVVTVAAGTPLSELQALLAAEGQMLAFEPPHFGSSATVGGCVAAGLAGPRRVAAGSLRDFVLGAKLLDGRGQLLSFGGTVMKNVAGYDVARTLAGSLGILGVITEVSLKVLPQPRQELTLRMEAGEEAALSQLAAWAGQPLPISASAWWAGSLWLRLSGSPAALRAGRVQLGGELADGDALWPALREQSLEFFAGDLPLWRLSVPATAATLGLGDAQLIEWGGALRWLRSAAPAEDIRRRVSRLGGHATLFRGGDRASGVFTELPPVLAEIHRRLKQEFDPAGIINPGRLVAGL